MGMGKLIGKYFMPIKERRARPSETNVSQKGLAILDPQGPEMLF